MENQSPHILKKPYPNENDDGDTDLAETMEHTAFRKQKSNSRKTPLISTSTSTTLTPDKDLTQPQSSINTSSFISSNSERVERSYVPNDINNTPSKNTTNNIYTNTDTSTTLNWLIRRRSRVLHRLNQIKEILLRNHGLFWAGVCICICQNIFTRVSTASGPYSGQNQGPLYGNYEKYRHWMEITVNIPPHEWYRDTIRNPKSYWGLDEPPITAYISYLAGKVAQYLGYGNLVELETSRGYETSETKVFMRLSVLLIDLIIYVPVVTTSIWSLFRRYRSVSRMIVVISMFHIPLLLLLDHGHFQYSSLCVATILLTTTAVLRQRLFLTLFFLVIALCTNQLALYFALPIFTILTSLALRQGYAQMMESETIKALTELEMRNECNLTNLERISKEEHRCILLKSELFTSKEDIFMSDTMEGVMSQNELGVLRYLASESTSELQINKKWSGIGYENESRIGNEVQIENGHGNAHGNGHGSNFYTSDFTPHLNPSTKFTSSTANSASSTNSLPMGMGNGRVRASLFYKYYNQIHKFGILLHRICTSIGIRVSVEGFRTSNYYYRMRQALRISILRKNKHEREISRLARMNIFDNGAGKSKKKNLLSKKTQSIQLLNLEIPTSIPIKSALIRAAMENNIDLTKIPGYSNENAFIYKAKTDRLTDRLTSRLVCEDGHNGDVSPGPSSTTMTTTTTTTTSNMGMKPTTQYVYNEQIPHTKDESNDCIDDDDHHHNYDDYDENQEQAINRRRLNNTKALHIVKSKLKTKLLHNENKIIISSSGRDEPIYTDNEDVTSKKNKKTLLQLLSREKDKQLDEKSHHSDICDVAKQVGLNLSKTRENIKQERVKLINETSDCKQAAHPHSQQDQPSSPQNSEDEYQENKEQKEQEELKEPKQHVTQDVKNETQDMMKKKNHFQIEKIKIPAASSPIVLTRYGLWFIFKLIIAKLLFTLFILYPIIYSALYTNPISITPTSSIYVITNTIHDISSRVCIASNAALSDKIATFWGFTSIFVNWSRFFSSNSLAMIATILPILFSLPSLVDLFLRPTSRRLIVSLTTVSLAFYLFSFQVDEKSIVIPAAFIQLQVLYQPNVTYLFQGVALLSCYPLVEKDNLYFFYFIYQLTRTSTGPLDPIRLGNVPFIFSTSPWVASGYRFARLFCPVRTYSQDEYIERKITSNSYDRYRQKVLQDEVRDQINKDNQAKATLNIATNSQTQNNPDVDNPPAVDSEDNIHKNPRFPHQKPSHSTSSTPPSKILLSKLRQDLPTEAMWFNWIIITSLHVSRELIPRDSYPNLSNNLFIVYSFLFFFMIYVYFLYFQIFLLPSHSRTFTIDIPIVKDDTVSEMDHCKLSYNTQQDRFLNSLYYKLAMIHSQSQK